MKEEEKTYWKDLKPKASLLSKKTPEQEKEEETETQEKSSTDFTEVNFDDLGDD